MFVRSGALYVPARSLGRVTVPLSGRAPVPLPPYVPSNEAELRSWASDQTEVWNRPEVKQMISDTRAGIGKAVQKEFPATAPLAEDETLDWCMSYVQSKGFPSTTDDAVEMTMAFLEEQGQAIGFHPAFLNAAELYEDWPDSPEEGIAWMHKTAANIGAQYGVPIPTDLNAKSLVTAAASASMQVAGVPGVAVASVTIEALWDGSITKEEMHRMVVATGAAVGAAVGQMFGIPAPIGGFVGSIVTDALYVELGKVFGWTESAADKRGRAWNEMLKARAALMSRCYEAARDAWDKYNEYWNTLIDQLQIALNDQAPHMGQGLRYFGTFVISHVEDDSGKRHKLPHLIARNCESPSGCLYYESYTEQRGTYVRYPGAKPEYRYNMPNVEHTGNAAPGARNVSGGNNYIDAYLALGYWGAERFVTPFHALRDYFGAPGGWLGTGGTRCWVGGRTSGHWAACWADVPHTDEEYLQQLAYIRSAPRPEELEMCIVPKWTEYMFESLAQVGPATSLVTANIGQTVAAVRAEQQVAAEMALAQQQAAAGAARLLAVKAAQARRDILRARRDQASNEALLNAGLLASGLGALAGWAASEILRR